MGTRYFLTAAVDCQECKGTGLVQHPAWAALRAAVDVSSMTEKQIRAWFADALGFDRVPDEEYRCTECNGEGTFERRAALEEALAGLEPSTNGSTNPGQGAGRTGARMAEDEDAIEAADAAIYDAHHVEWELERERNDLRDEVKRLRTALREISTLEGADPDGTVWTWKDLFCKAEDIARQALEVDG